MTYFRLDDRAAYLPASDALVLSDVHFGADERGLEAELTALTNRARRLVTKYAPRLTIIAGDLYEIPRGSDLPTPEMRDAFARFHTVFDNACEEVIITPGNHEARARLGPADLPGRVEPEHRLDADATVVCHGHDLPQMAGDLYILGHGHPHLDDEGACYLYGQNVARDAALLVLPPFNRAVGGTSIEEFHDDRCYIPLVREEGDPEHFRPFVIDEEATPPPT